MKKLITLSFVFLLVVATTAVSALASQLVRDTYHNDHRSTPKLQFEPQWAAPGGLSRDGVPEAFIEMEGSKYLLPTDPEDLQFLEMKESLLGYHYTYQQHLHGIPVEGGDFIVSVAKKDRRVYRVYNNTYPVNLKPQAPSGTISEERAYDAVWQELRGHGELLAPALSRLVYQPEGDGFVLNYLVDMALSAPYGSWHVTVDALDGVVTRIEDGQLINKTHEDMPTIADRLAEYSGPATDRQAAFARLAERERQEELALEKANRALGTGVVFDPDPRTTLRNNNLQDYTSAASFTEAYFTRDLQDITFSGGLYRLTGPWVYISNWDPPNTAPSTTSDGNWTQTRGDNAFNDAMTYFHLDQNQRYIQSLGFTGATGIQEGSIRADSDGVNGQDNSYYIPAYNRLAFGHGCVDDNEDADVIIHEYGHAIQHDITNWAGGDTGGMGEGFSDYWGGSYSFSTPNGPLFYPNWIYTWDGHGATNHCWYGRVLNATSAMYNPNVVYGAHQSIGGGYQSDELWSTPLFQTLLTLTDQGYPREECDQIILESHFGIGFGPTMRDMGNATVATAALLQPDGPHAEVFTEKFLAQNIIELPFVELAPGAVTITNSPGANGLADPGETVHLSLEVINNGTIPAEGVSAVLSSPTPLVTIVSGTSDYEDLPDDASGSNIYDYVISLDQDFPCGDKVDLTLTFTFNNNRTVSTVDFKLSTGAPQIISVENTDNLSIPDNNGTGIESHIVISGTDAVVTEDFSVDVRIIHPYIGDLRVILVSPGGIQVWLHNRTGDTTNAIIGNYPNTLTPFYPLDVLYGQPLDGTWTLRLIDWAAGSTGFLDNWAVNDVGGFECETGVSPVGDELAPLRFAVGQNHPNPFNPSTTISFAVPENAGTVQLAVFDISGRLIRTLESASLTAGHYTRVWDGRDAAGRTVSSGAYFYRLSGRGFTEARKMILMK